MAGTAGAELKGESVAAIALGAVDWFAAARDVASTAGVAVLEMPCRLYLIRHLLS
ncbi:hypothetical protein E4U35_001785 [Claviceps purpurea]|nr:hypothetical protein E4U35_001785 [Claviceps purpurea]